MAMHRKTVFVSYAHEDRDWAESLVGFLSPWIRNKRLTLWDDSLIRTGTNWSEEIDRAIDEASVAVLLVTKDFLASDYIMEKEFPKILEKSNNNQLTIIWVAVSHAAYELTPLIKLQSANDIENPLESLSIPARNDTLLKISRDIADAITIGTLAGGLHIIDETTEPLEAALEGRKEDRSRSFGVLARYESSQNQIVFSGMSTTITAEDLKNLPDDDKEFISDLEDALRRNYGRWSEVKKQLGEAGGALDGEIRNQLTRIAKLMCRDLNHILDFLRKIHKAELEDHYGRYRYICDQLDAA